MIYLIVNLIFIYFKNLILKLKKINILNLQKNDSFIKIF